MTTVICIVSLSLPIGWKSEAPLISFASSLETSSKFSQPVNRVNQSPGMCCQNHEMWAQERALLSFPTWVTPRGIGRLMLTANSPQKVTTPKKTWRRWERWREYTSVPTTCYASLGIGPESSHNFWQLCNSQKSLIYRLLLFVLSRPGLDYKDSLGLYKLYFCVFIFLAYFKLCLSENGPFIRSLGPASTLLAGAVGVGNLRPGLEDTPGTPWSGELGESLPFKEWDGDFWSKWAPRTIKDLALAVFFRLHQQKTRWWIFQMYLGLLLYSLCVCLVRDLAFSWSLACLISFVRLTAKQSSYTHLFSRNVLDAWT